MKQNTELRDYIQDELFTEYPNQKILTLTVSQFQDLILGRMSKDLEESFISDFKNVALINAPEEVLNDLEIALNSEKSNLIEAYLSELRDQAFFKCIAIGKMEDAFNSDADVDLSVA